MGMLAERAGVTTAYISRLEHGQYASPGSAALMRIASALGVSLEDLTAETDPPPVPLAGRVVRTDDLDLPIYQSHAGRLILADSTTLDHFQIRADRTYMVRAIGDCLFDDDIHDGDLLIVDSQARAQNGRIVVVRIADETFLVKWRRKDGVVELELSDGQFREALVHDIDVQGVVVHVLKQAP